ncbi:unnamed protein product [Prunus armeniaca]|uniref:Reverse transcriptase zinc-binding domain-containing protein n=1 Tax=Prunus armeniaca TaxID=36596 RepID=A0A6J5UD54_PRUAR|nr:unnamed protein product [Prunus armeniaca]
MGAKANHFCCDHPFLHGMKDTRVSELICNESSPQWDLQKLNNLILPMDVANIARIPLGIRALPDQIVWHYDNHGVFTGVDIQELCLFCGDTIESALHVLVLCPFAVATWDISMLTRHAHQDALKWAAPPSCHLKLNFDGAFDPTSGRGAVGVVSKDRDGGLALALSLGIASPIFEGDSAVVVAAVKEANGVVHGLARFGLLTVDNFTWFEVPPGLIQDALFCDVLSWGQA